MNKYKILTIELMIAILLGSISTYSYIKETLFFENLNNKILDAFFVYRGNVKADENIVIVDIDEKSLSVLGQWPWSRDAVAQVLVNLANAEVGIVGLDIVFAESDRSSPKKVLSKFGLSHEEAEDYDEVLAYVLANSPTISGYLFNFEAVVKKGIEPNISAIIIEKNKQDSEFLPVAKGLVSNIPLLQKKSFSSGFFNTIPDSDGIVRSVPLAVRYDESIYPSLSLEMIRLILGSKKVVFNYSDIGINSIGIGKVSIPTDRFGRLNVNYAGKAKAYRYISAIDIYNNEFKKEDIKGKIVLIGTSAGGLLDLRATPLESTYPGVEIHANVLDNILNQNFITYPNWVEAVDILIILIMLISIVVIFTFFGAYVTALSFTFFILSLVGFSYWLFINEGIVLNIIYPLLSSTIFYMTLTSLHYLLESKQKDLIKSKLSKKVSAAVADSLIKQGNIDIFEAQEKEVSIFFSDIRGFTSISEAFKNPKELIELLNMYMTPMTDIITKNQGTVDKFIGDAIMAYWNAPNSVENHADKALQSACEQIRTLEKLNKELKEKGYPRIDIGIGINTGNVVVGEMGSVGRSDYTIIGDSVNLGSRIEGLCKTYKAQILISEYTKEKLKEVYDIVFLDEVKVKGKEEAVKIYKVIV